MSLPVAWVDRIFDKLTLVYGAEFIRRWEGQDLNAVKSDWAHELSSFQRWPSAITFGLQNLPERAPNVMQFKTICRGAPSAPEPAQALPQPEGHADPERLKAALALLTDRPKYDRKAWARRLIDRHESGEFISTITGLAMARGALREDIK